MSVHKETEQNGTLGRFLLVSFVLHVILLVLYPQWQVSPLPGTLPGEGAIQLSLRQSPESHSQALRRVTPDQLPTQVPPTPRPQPRAVEPTPEPPAQVQAPTPKPQQQPAAVEAPVPPKPDVQPQPTPAERVVEPVAPPQADPRPVPAPQPVERVASETPVVTSDTGTVPVATEPREAAPSEEGGPAAEASAEPVEAEAPPAPAPPPPYVGAMLTLPGGQFFPKSIRLEGTVSIRVIITVDETGNIVHSEIDPATRSDNPDANEFAIRYATQLVKAEASPQGESYQAALVVTFNPDAEGFDGVRSSTDETERIRLFGSN